ncbi:MAG TPA: hypothetical protein ENH91_08030, partial [Leeuwenhoekiella sp.]|nr:hypothetical protein [Leeuwenhoekiella sp.]
FYSIPLIGTRYTEGIKYLAEEANCYWLITDASVIAKSLMNQSYFITIDFERLSEKDQEANGCEAKLKYCDGNDNLFEVHRYNVTDFPLDELRLFFVDGCLMLPGEY